jgi:hypothetical protein
MTSRAAGLALGLAALLLATPTAALMREIPLPTLAATSDAIVSAHVVSRQSHWLASPHIIVTDVRLHVDEAWSGALARGDEISLRVEGGIVGRIRMWSEHQPIFAVGEQVVLFLSRGESWSVNGLEQGRYAVHEGRTRDWQGRTLSLESFRASIRSMVSARGREGPR